MNVQQVEGNKNHNFMKDTELRKIIANQENLERILSLIHI